MLQFITVKDLSDKIDEKYYRQSSLEINSRKPKSLRVVGVLPHGHDITFDRKNAVALIKWLQALLAIKELERMRKEGELDGIC